MMVSDLKSIISKATGKKYTDEQLAEIVAKLETDSTTSMSILDSLGINYVTETIGDKYIVKIVNGETGIGEKLEFNLEKE